jgi:hypothetical protein
MLAKPLLLIFIAACGVLAGAAAPAEQPEKKPPDKDVGDQHFCCFSVGVTAAGKPTGDGCVTIGAGNIDTCDKVLFCNGNWIKEDGKVTCL